MDADRFSHCLHAQAKIKCRKALRVALGYRMHAAADILEALLDPHLPGDLKDHGRVVADC